MLKKKNGYNSISDSVYEKLFELIVSGKLEPGQKITEQALAESEGVSRAPIREAIKRLAEDRLITLVPRSGCYVCKITREDVVEVFEIRKRLECLALEYAFENLDRERVARLRNKFVECGPLEEKKAILKELKLDGELHGMIYDACGRRNLQDLLGKLVARVRLFRTRGTTKIEKARVAMQTHINILDAILSGDLNAALRHLEQHIDFSRDNSLEDLDG